VLDRTNDNALGHVLGCAGWVIVLGVLGVGRETPRGQQGTGAGGWGVCWCAVTGQQGPGARAGACLLGMCAVCGQAYEKPAAVARCTYACMTKTMWRVQT
jgi:hypothetical protein